MEKKLIVEIAALGPCSECFQNRQKEDDHMVSVYCPHHLSGAYWPKRKDDHYPSWNIITPSSEALFDGMRMALVKAMNVSSGGTVH